MTSTSRAGNPRLEQHLQVERRRRLPPFHASLSQAFPSRTHSLNSKHVLRHGSRSPVSTRLRLRTNLELGIIVHLIPQSIGDKRHYSLEGKREGVEIEMAKLKIFDAQNFKFGTDLWDPSHRFETSWLLPPWVLFGIRAVVVRPPPLQSNPIHTHLLTTPVSLRIRSNLLHNRLGTR